MQHRFVLLFCFAMLIADWVAPATWAGPGEVTVGVLAYRGDAASILRWTPTIRYLAEDIPGSEFQLLPLGLEEMSHALGQRKLDFILTNPGNYVELERRFGISRIATLKNLRQGQPYTMFGAVILVRADREDIRTLPDLKGKSFGAVSEAAFGGFQMAWRELNKAGVDPYRDFSRLRFFDFPQDNIVLGVRDREIDAGTVRTDIL
jgi:ABC-type phosphate/phosphonate transport system substrate-binding protein